MIKPIRRAKVASLGKRSLSRLVLVVLGFGCGIAVPPNLAAEPSATEALGPAAEELLSAARYGELYEVEALVAAGADVNGQDRNGETALMAASKNDHPGVVKALLAGKANVNIKNNKGGSAVSLASHNGSQDVVDLLERREPIAIAQEQRLSPDTYLCYAALGAGRIEDVREYISGGANVNAVCEDGSSPLHYAAASGNMQLARLLILNGANIDKKSVVENDTALHKAIMHAAISKEQKGIGGRPSDYLLEEPKYMDLVTFLLKQGADPNIVGFMGTPLHIAAITGRAGFAKLLIRHGANVNARNGFGSTPMHFAAEKGYRDVMAVLLENGGSLDIPNGEGKTARDLLFSNPDR